jgi:hypothetical protein
MTVNQFFDNFLADGARFGMDHFFIRIGNTQVSIEDNWHPVEKTKMLRGIVPVTGVPFINKTRHEKLMKIVDRTDTMLRVTMDNISLDAPYGDSFMVREEWLVTSSSAHDRSILR